MSEARDRLSRPEDVTSIFVRRRQSIRSMGILSDEPEVGLETPFRWGTMAMTGPHQQVGVAAAATRGGSFGTPRNAMGRGRTWFRSPAIGLLNTPIGSSQRGRGRGRGRSTNSVLPSWYPRTPLRDITAVVRAIERRRDRLREIEGQQIESPLSQEQFVPDPPESTPGVQLEHGISIVSPNPNTLKKPCPPLSVGKVPKILLDITNPNSGESDCLTPQKKLLNSIDTVEKAVMEELRKLKRTPSAKKAEREKRVRTLMSMR